MPDVFCPICKTNLKVPDALAGKKVKCVKCSNTLMVQAQAAARGTIGNATRPNSQLKTAPTAPRKPGGPIKVLILVGGGLALLFLCVLTPIVAGTAWWFLSAKPTREVAKADHVAVARTEIASKTEPADAPIPVTPESIPPAWGIASAGKLTLAIDAEGHSGMIRRALLRNRGRQAITVSLDKTVRFWDVDTGDLLQVLWMPSGPGENGQLEAAALSRDETVLAVAGRAPDGGPAPLFLISPESAQLMRVIPGKDPLIRALAFTPDGKGLAAGGSDRVARIYNVGSGQVEQSFSHNSELHALAFSPDGQRLLAGAENEVKIWPVSGGRFQKWWSPSTFTTMREIGDRPRNMDEVRDQFVGGNKITAVAWDPEGKNVAAGCDKGAIWIYDAVANKPTVKRIHLSQSPITIKIQPVNALQYTLDGKALVYGGSNALGEPASGVYELATDKRLAELTHPLDSPVLAGGTSADGQLAISSAGTGNETIVWRTADGTEAALLAGSGRLIGGFPAWSQDGQTLGWKQSRTPAPTYYPLDRAFSLEEMQLVESPTEKTIPWAMRTMPVLEKYRVRLAKQWIHRLPINPALVERDETRLFCGREDEQLESVCALSKDRVAIAGKFAIYVADLEKMQVTHTLTGHTAPVKLLVASPDGRRLASVSLDQTIRIWDPNQNDPLLSLFATDSEWVVWSPQGYYAASAGGERLMGWKSDNGPRALATFYPAAQFRKSLYRPQLLQRLMQSGNLAAALAQEKSNLGPASVEQARPPLAAILYPPGPVGHRITGTQLTVRAAARSVGKHPVTALRLLVDGRPQGGMQGVRKVATPRLGDFNVSWPIELPPGKHLLAVQAESAVSTGLSPIVEVTNVGDESPPNLFVVAAGINAYPSPLTLNFAAPDAEAIGKALSDRINQKVFSRVEVKLIRDQEATRANLEQALDWLKARMTPRDVGIFFFSGHGHRDGSNFFLVPVDVEARNLAGSCVSGTYLKQTLGAIPGRVIAILDACHSGAALEARRRPPAADDLIRDLVSDDYGIVVLSSSLGQEYSLESNTIGHGFFTQALVEGLSGLADRNRNGKVDLTELDRYVRQRVSQLSGDRQHPVGNRPPSIHSFALAASARLPERVAPAPPPVVVLTPQADKSPLQGLWQLQSYVRDGEPRDTRDYFWAIHRDEIRHDVGSGSDIRWKFTLNAGAKPNQIDLSETHSQTRLLLGLIRSQGRGVPIDLSESDPSIRQVLNRPGIFSVEGDTLNVCFRVGAGPRPTEFGAAKGSQMALLMLKRASTDPNAPKPFHYQPLSGARIVGSNLMPGTDGSIHFLGQAPDGRTLFVGTYRGVKAWDGNTRKTTQAILQGEQSKLVTFNVNFSRDGKTMVYENRVPLTVHVMEVATGKELASVRSEKLNSTALSPDGKQVALAAFSVRLINVADRQERKLLTLPNGSRPATSIEFSPDGRLLAVAQDRRVILFDTTTGAEVRRCEATQAVDFARFSPDGKMLAGGCSWDRVIKLWEVSTGREIREFRGHESPLSGVAFSTDGKWLVSSSAAGSRGEIKVWEVTSGTQRATMSNLNGPVETVADGRHVVASASALSIWQLTFLDGSKP